MKNLKEYLPKSMMDEMSNILKEIEDYNREARKKKLRPPRLHTKKIKQNEFTR